MVQILGLTLPPCQYPFVFFKCVFQTSDKGCAALQEMGFIDQQANINALQATGGNVSAAVARLCEQGNLPS